MNIRIIAILGFSLLLVGCSDLLKSDVEYTVTGTATTVSLTYENEDGGTSQIGSVPLPWSYSFKAKSDDFLYVSAQNNGSSGGLTVSIYVNGSKRKTSSSSGAYVIATAYDSL